MMNTCDTCKYWSERIAQSIGGGPVEALCLSDEGPNKSEYTTARKTCECYEKGTPIDSPKSLDENTNG